MGPFAQSASFTPVSPAGTFDLSGTLSDGAVLGGAMILDEVAGTVTAASFTIGAPDSVTTSVIRRQHLVRGMRGKWIVDWNDLPVT